MERSIYLDTGKTYYDRIYVRNYQPDVIKRLEKGDTPYLNEHLGANHPYKGNPDSLFKSLLKKRTVSQEKTAKMSFKDDKKRENEADRSAFDSSFKDMSLFYKPDFRAIPVNFYKTVFSPEHKSLEKGFKSALPTSFKGKIDHQAWFENNGSITKMDPYRDGHEEIGKLKRDRSKERDISPQEFLVNTSSINTILEA